MFDQLLKTCLVVFQLQEFGKQWHDVLRVGFVGFETGFLLCLPLHNDIELGFSEPLCQFRLHITIMSAMYNTIDIPPARMIHTSEVKTRDVGNLTFRPTMTATSGERRFRSHHCDLLRTHRPGSSMTIDSTISYCSKREGKDFLLDSLGSDVSNYIVRRIHSHTKKREQSLIEQKMELPGQIDAWIETERSTNQPKSYLNSKMCTLLQAKTHRTLKVIA